MYQLVTMDTHYAIVMFHPREGVYKVYENVQMKAILYVIYMMTGMLVNPTLVAHMFSQMAKTTCCYDGKTQCASLRLKSLWNDVTVQQSTA